jgi:hypothetical protein
MRTFFPNVQEPISHYTCDIPPMTILSAGIPLSTSPSKSFKIVFRDSSIPSATSLLRSESSLMSYQLGMAIPPFMLTRLTGAVGRRKRTWGRDEDQRRQNFTQPSAVPPEESKNQTCKNNPANHTRCLTDKYFNKVSININYFRCLNEVWATLLSLPTFRIIALRFKIIDHDGCHGQKRDEDQHRQILTQPSAVPPEESKHKHLILAPSVS